MRTFESLPGPRDQEQERMYLQVQRGGRRYQNEWEEEDEEEKEEDEEEAVQDGGDRALAGLRLGRTTSSLALSSLWLHP